MTGYFHCLCADQELASAFGESVRGEARFAADGTLDVIDLTVILGVIHAKRRFGAQSVANPRILATLVKLERLFEREYPINRSRPANCAPAMGRRMIAIFGGGVGKKPHLELRRFRLSSARKPRTLSRLSDSF